MRTISIYPPLFLSIQANESEAPEPKKTKLADTEQVPSSEAVANDAASKESGAEPEGPVKKDKRRRDKKKAKAEATSEDKEVDAPVTERSVMLIHICSTSFL
jgi:hypothetical protein